MFFLTVAAAFGQLQPNAPWPKFLANAQNTGLGTGAGSTGMVNWFSATGHWDASVESSPAIGADGTVYIGCDNGDLYALDGATGHIKWTFPTTTNYYEVISTPAIGADGTVYVGFEDGNVYALDGSTGTMKWSFAGGEFKSSPAIGSDGTIYIGSMEGVIYALNGADGSLEWSYTTGGAVATCPAIGPDGTVYVTSQDNNIYALNGADGQLVWSAGALYPSSPSVGAGLVYVCSAVDGMQAFDETTGAVQWTFSNRSSFSSPAIGPTGNVYFGDTGGVVHAVDGTTGQEIWSYQTGSIIYGSAAVAADGTVYICSNSTLFVLNGATGEAQWTFGAGYAPDSSPAIGADGTVYFGEYESGFNGYEGVLALGSSQLTLMLGTSSVSDVQKVVGGLAMDYSVWTAGPGAVKVTSNNPSVANIAPGGAIKTSGVATPTTVTFTATQGSNVATATLTVTPASLEAITASSPTIGGGDIDPCLVQLQGNAAPGGTPISLSSSNTSLATVPAVYNVPGNSSIGFFPITTYGVTSNAQVTITAQAGGVMEETTITLIPPTFTGLVLGAGALWGSQHTHGEVIMSGPVASATTMTLSSSSPSAVVPASVTIPVGQSTALFTITSTPVATQTFVTIQATLGSVTETQILTIDPPGVTGLTAPNNQLVVGQSTAATVQWNYPVAVATSLSLHSTNAALTFPASVPVAGGASSVTFTITGSPVSSPTAVQIYAVFGNSWTVGWFTVYPQPLNNLGLSPSVVTGSESCSATVSMGYFAYVPVTVTLSSNSPAAAVPPYVTIPAGQWSAPFTISTRPVTATAYAVIQAKWGTVTLSKTLDVNPAVFSSLSLIPNTVTGGQSVTGVVVFSGPVARSAVIGLSSNDPHAVVPNSVTVQAGQSAAIFTITTLAVSASTQVSISADVGSTQISEPLEIDP